MITFCGEDMKWTPYIIVYQMEGCNRQIIGRNERQSMLLSQITYRIVSRYV